MAGAAQKEKPGSLREFERSTWSYIARRSTRGFLDDDCPDLAAGLTYYAVLAMFPAAIALLSLIGVFARGSNSVGTLLGILSDVGGTSVADTLRPTLEQLSKAPGAGFTFVLGIAGALWSASGYVGAFGRALNRIYGIDEGRPVWKLRPMMLLVTAVLVVLAVAALLGLVVSGPVARAVGDAMGLGHTAVTVWGILKWPVILIAVAFIITILFWATPNVRPPGIKWLGAGAGVAIVAWLALTTAFGFYVANFSSYNRTYGSLAGVIVFLLWLWITNLALLFGAELNVELERGRQLQAGLKAEDSVKLELRDDSGVKKAETRLQDYASQGRKVRRGRRKPP